LVSYFHVWLSRSSYCSKSGPGFKEFSPVTVIVLTTGLVSQRSLLGASQARFHPNCRTSIGRSGSRLAGAGETPVCLVVSSPRWHLVSSRFEVAPIRSRVHELLIAAATRLAHGRKRPGQNGANLSAIAPGRASTVAICDYRWGRANNAAERAIRPAVLWRRTSFSESSGKSFVARMLSVMTTLRSQNRDVLAYLACCRAAPRETCPSLLPLCLASTRPAC